MQAQATPEQELRFDDIDEGDLYHGRAIAGADTALAIWEIVKFTRDTEGVFERAQYVSGAVWDDRTNPAYWS